MALSASHDGGRWPANLSQIAVARRRPHGPPAGRKREIYAASESQRKVPDSIRPPDDGQPAVWHCIP